jgi:excisionase family DNA binding protein
MAWLAMSSPARLAIVRIDPSPDLEVIDWYLGGLTLEQVAAKAGMPRSRVVRVLDSHGVPRRPRGRPRQIAARGAQAEGEIIDVYLSGLSLVATGAAFGVGGSTVARVLERHGVRRRPRGRPRREVPPAEKADDGNRWLKVREVAKLLRTSPATVYRMIRHGELTAIRVCERGLRVRESVVWAYLDAQTVVRRGEMRAFAQHGGQAQRLGAD